MTDDIAALLFNLASADRLDLLSEISARKQRLTSLSKVIHASAQECSRHLARLSDAGLIQKDSEGHYEVTPLGKAVQIMLPGIEFLLGHTEYFLSHDVSFLPRSFVERVGELSAGEYVNHISLVIEHIKSVISEAKEFVWLISDQPIVVGTIGTIFSFRDLSLRLIGEETVDRTIIGQLKAALPRSEAATFPEVKVAMAINENIAGICFPGRDGKIDFSAGFLGKDPTFRTWCSDLFDSYWSRSQKIMASV
jgi:predicted transcriptional regulator